MLDAGQLASLRATQEVAMDTMVTILRALQASDGQGGVTESWPTAAEAAASGSTALARIGVPTGRVLAQAARMGERVDVVVTLPWDTDVQRGDRIVLTSGSLATSGSPLEVTGVLGPYPTASAKRALGVGVR